MIPAALSSMVQRGVALACSSPRVPLRSRRLLVPTNAIANRQVLRGLCFLVRKSGAVEEEEEDLSRDAEAPRALRGDDVDLKDMPEEPSPGSAALEVRTLVAPLAHGV
jgi:hypothetical protein